MTRLVKKRARTARMEKVRHAQEARRAQRASLENPNVSLEDFSEWFGGGGRSRAGPEVTVDTALNFSTVKSCVSILAESVAVLPMKAYRRKPEGGKEEVSSHPAHVALHESPNPEMTPVVFKETLQAHLGLVGGAFARIVPAGMRDVHLWPLDPQITEPKRDKSTGKLRYVTEWRGRKVNLEPEEVLHIPGLSWNGVQGLSPVGYQRESVGLGMAAEQFAGSALASGAWLSLLVEHPGVMDDAVYERFKKSMAEDNLGLANAFKPAILEDGMKAKPVSMPTGDALFMTLRKFQKREIASWYRIPPHMLADMEGGASYSSIEVMSTEFVRYTLGIWLTKWKQECSRKLAGDGVFIDFVADAFLEGSTKERYEAYKTAGGGVAWVDMNEIREKENMPPVEGGDGPVRPVNVVVAGQEAVVEDESPSATEAVEPEVPAEESGERVKGAARVARDELESSVAAAYGRLVKKEADRLTRHAKKAPEEFVDWLSSFYSAHRGHALEIVEAHVVGTARVIHALRGGEDPVSLGRRVARETIDKDLRVSERAAAGHHGEGDLESLLVRWQQHRPKRLGEAIASALYSEGERDVAA